MKNAPTTAVSAPDRVPSWYLLVVSVLWLGWSRREDVYLSAGHGAGYVFGILGLSAMLLVAAYAMRKRWRVLRGLGAMQRWFRVHMVLGVLGPVLILFHCNFRLGSINSRVALVSMFLVTASGLVGRYLYARVHHGLYGRKATLESLRNEARASTGRLVYALAFAPDVISSLEHFEEVATARPANVIHGALRVLSVGMRARWMQVRLSMRARTRLGVVAARAGWTRQHAREQTVLVRKYLAEHFATIRKVVQFGFYEGLFSLWHVIHVPLFVMLVVASFVHVVAVHRY